MDYLRSWTLKTVLGIIVVLLLALLIARSFGIGKILNAEPFVHTILDGQGNQSITDTPRMWSNWVENVNFRVANEATGIRPEGGHQDWNEFWISLIETNQTSRENPQKYIDYIIERRRVADLPPLKGYP